MLKYVRDLLCVSILSMSSALASVQDVLNEPMFVNDDPTSFLWDISYQGQTVGALLGTFHTGKIGSVLPDKVAEYLDKSDELITENVVVFQSEKDSVKDALFMLNFFTSRQTLSERFTPEVVTQLKQYLAKQGLHESQYDKMTDIYLLMLTMIDLGESYDIQYGMESLISEFIRQNKQAETYSNVGLESLPESIRLLQDAMGDKLREGIEEYFTYREVTMPYAHGMSNCYQNNDVKCLLNEMLMAEQVIPLTDEEKVEVEVMMRKINEDRNHNWMPQLLPALKNKPSGFKVIAVGGLHLFGKEGLIELLRKEGFELSPVLY